MTGVCEESSIPDTHWDAIIVGTGMGGATLGLALAKKGKRVLFCEKGRSSLFGRPALRGAYPEELILRSAAARESRSDTLADAGRFDWAAAAVQVCAYLSRARFPQLLRSFADGRVFGD